MDDYRRRLHTFLYADFAPAMKILLGLYVLVFLMRVLAPVDNLLPLIPGHLLERPWTLLTYPLSNGQIFMFLLICIWWWFIAGGMERIWGTRRFVLSWIVIVAGAGIGLLVGMLLCGRLAFISGLALPLTGLTVAWGLTHRGQQILLYGLIPIRSIWLAWLSPALLFVSYANIHPLVGLFSLTGCGLGYLLIGGGPPDGRRPRPVRSKKPKTYLHRVK